MKPKHDGQAKRRHARKRAVRTDRIEEHRTDAKVREPGNPYLEGTKALPEAIMVSDTKGRTRMVWPAVVLYEVKSDQPARNIDADVIPYPPAFDEVAWRDARQGVDIGTRTRPFTLRILDALAYEALLSSGALQNPPHTAHEHEVIVNGRRVA